MVLTGPTRRRAAARIALAGLTALAVVLGGQTPGSAQLPAAPASPGAQPPSVAGYGQVDTPAVQIPGPLPKRTGSVPHVAPKGGASAKAALVNDQVTLKALIIATNTDDFGVATWKATLDRVGAKYDVLYAATTNITTSTLVAGGVGKYNAILLTNSMLLVPSGANYVSALDSTEWNLLWNYELNFGVRQAALYTSYGTWPENYCLNGVGEGAVGDTPEPVTLTAAGAGVFDYLNASAQIPIQSSYVYRTSLAANCGGQPLLQDANGNVLAVKVAAGGREKIALTFTSNVNIIQSDLLVYGLFEWATKGLFLGERKYHLNVDIDDWFNSADHYHEDGTVEYDPGFRVSGHDTVNLAARQAALRTEHPKAADFTFNLAYNGGDIDPFAGDTCYPDGDETTLTSTTKCLKDSFNWINHTVNHPELNATDYNTSLAEIEQNLTLGTGIGLNVPVSILKTPEYSGLGVYNDDPDNDTGPPTDHGLTGSNQAFLDAAAAAGVTHVHGNMSFASHVPANFNTSIVHPLKNSIKVVPDWPTNIAYHTTTPAEETHFYNSFYGPGGLFPYWPTNRTYQQILEYEAGVIGFQHVATGSIYSHTFHIANVREYGNGNTLVTDWVDTILDRYEATYNVPLLSPSWTGIASYTDARNAHFAALPGATAVYDRAAGTISVSSTTAGTLQVGGVATTVAGATSYGSAVTAPVTVTAGGAPVVVTAAARL
ncbi:Agd3-related carbohydrate-binding protein [Catenuloplanes atrovinosus]|uniref:Agd3 CBM87 domain-containing protein n=1 Tax=Catenuloplanes atrovinosus TaxID=137266 RepID=A0AAE4CAI7_9ACTN|nr:hypothetical protein [Catenuloplanes atrovinosus]MDR7275864.1 hypothetical protein [Catenuloplanes atrovinosus]